MSVEENKALAQRWFAEGWNKGNTAVADAIFAPHFTLNGIEVGAEGPKQNVICTRKGLPDMTFTVEDQVAEADTVVTRWTARGTYPHDFYGKNGGRPWHCHLAYRGWPGGRRSYGLWRSNVTAAAWCSSGLARAEIIGGDAYACFAGARDQRMQEGWPGIGFAWPSFLHLSPLSILSETGQGSPGVLAW